MTMKKKKKVKRLHTVYYVPVTVRFFPPSCVCLSTNDHYLRPAPQKDEEEEKTGPTTPLSTVYKLIVLDNNIHINLFCLMKREFGKSVEHSKWVNNNFSFVFWKFRQMISVITIENLFAIAALSFRCVLMLSVAPFFSTTLLQTFAHSHIDI